MAGNNEVVQLFYQTVNVAAVMIVGFERKAKP